MDKKLTDHELSFDVINTHIDTGIGTTFTLNEINDEIIRKGGILRVSIGFGTGAYLQNMAAIGILEPVYEADETTYKVAALGIKRAEKVVKRRKWPVPFYEDPHDH